MAASKLVYRCDTCGIEADWETQNTNWAEVSVEGACRDHTRIERNYCPECWPAIGLQLINLLGAQRR